MVKRKTIDKKGSNLPELIIAIIALILSMFSIGYTYFRDRENDSEIISLSYTSYGNDVNSIVEDFQIADLGINGLLPMNYGIIISNNSKKTISIVSSDVENITKKGMFSIPGQFEGIYSMELHKQQMPIVLNAGESKQYIIRIKLGLSTRVSEIIRKINPLPSNIEYKKISEALHKSNLDIYGNEGVTTKISGAELTTFNNIKFPEYFLTLRTSNNKVFRFVISSVKYSESQEF